MIANFNREFVKTGLFPRSMGKQLEKAFRFHTQGDYGMVPVSADAAAAVLSDAVEFLDTAIAFLKKEGFLPDSLST